MNLGQILTLAYNKAAEREFRQRTEGLGPNVQAKTLHAFGLEIIRENISELGYDRAPRPVQGEERLAPFVRAILKEESDTGLVDERLAQQIVSDIEKARSRVTEGLFDPSELRGNARQFSVAYEEFKKQNVLIDFQDMIDQAAHLLETNERVRTHYRARFPYVQVDEFQDVSPSEYRILRQLTENLFAVGDDDQAIYGFRGGDSRIMQEFREIADEYDVVENFRSREEIVDSMRGLIENARKRLDKDLKSTRGPGGSVSYIPSAPMNIEDVLRAQLEGTTQETAILTRTQYEKREVAKILARIENRPEVAVSTIHASKGLEFERVMVLLNTLSRHGGDLYRSFPSATNLEELEEERRLLYVAGTRAKDELLFIGDDPKFMRELGFIEDEPPAEDLKEVGDELVEGSKSIRERIADALRKFQARYQRIRTYQDMVRMEDDLQVFDVVENLSLAQVHRDKIEQMGQAMGYDPSPRTGAPTRLRGIDRVLSWLHQPGRVGATAFGGASAANLVNVGQGTFTGSALNLSTFWLPKLTRFIDEKLYPHPIRPSQQLHYRPLFHQLPERVREVLPPEIAEGTGLDSEGQLRNFRFVHSKLSPVHQPFFYEFPHETEGWEGASRDRPLFHISGMQMERVTDDEMEQLRQDLELTTAHTSLDTDDSSRNLIVRPYSQYGYEDIYERPRPVRSDEKLSEASRKLMKEMREYLLKNREGDRRPEWWRRRKFRLEWEWQHGRLLKQVNKFLDSYGEDEVVNFHHLSSVLNRMNRENTRVTMGAEGGSHDIGQRVIDLHREVLDKLYKVEDKDSPFYNPFHWIMARGKLHELPEGMGTANVTPDDIQIGKSMADAYTDVVEDTIQHATKDRMNRSALFVETFDDLGRSVRPGSGIYLGGGKFATALHTQLGQGGLMPTRGVVRGIAPGSQDIAIERFLHVDPERDLAIMQLEMTEALKDLEAAQLGTARRGQRLQVFGAGQQDADSPVEVGFTARGRYGREGRNIAEFTGGQLFPTQSGAGAWTRRLFRRGGGRVAGYVSANILGRGILQRSSHITEALANLQDLGGYGEAQLPTEQDIFKSLIDDFTSSNRESMLRQAYRQRGAYLGQRGFGLELAMLDQQADAIRQSGVPDIYAAETLTATEGRIRDIRGARYLTEREDFIRQTLGLDADADIDALDAGRFTRSYELGQRFRGTAVGQRLAPVADALSRFGGSGAVRGLGRGARFVGTVASKAFPVLELLDVVDKVDYLTGGAERRITTDVLKEGDVDEILNRFQLLTESRQLRTGSGFGVVSNLFRAGRTGLEEDYFEREGGLRDIGSLWSGLEWAERLPVVDPVLTAWDKVEKGPLGRLYDIYTDPTGRHTRGRIDEQLQALTERLQTSLPTMTASQQEAFGERLRMQERALEQELGVVGVYDPDAVGEQRSRIESELERVRAMTEGNIEYYSAGLGQTYMTSGRQVRSRAGVITQLESELADLPDARTANIRQQLDVVRRQRAALGGAEESPITTGLRIDLPQPLTMGRMAETPEVMRLPAIEVLGENLSGLQPTMAVSDVQQQVLGSNITRMSSITPPATSTGALRAMEAEALDAGNYMIVTPDGIVDGDTLRGKLFAPRIGMHGEEQSLRYESFDTAETDPTRLVKRMWSDPKYRDRGNIERESKRGERALELHREWLEQFRVTGEDGESQYIVPLDQLSGRKDAYGRVLGTPTGIDPYFEKAIQERVGRVRGSSAFFGDEAIPERTLRYTRDEIKRAEGYHRTIDADRLREQKAMVREATLERSGVLDAELDAFRTRGFTVGDLRGEGGLFERIAAERAISVGIGDQQGTLGILQGDLAEAQRTLEAERTAFEAVPISDRDPAAMERVDAAKARVAILKEAIEAEERVIRELDQTFNQGMRMLTALENDASKSRIELINARRTNEMQAFQTETMALRESLQEHSKIRTMLSERLLGDTEFVKQFESGMIKNLEGELESTQLTVGDYREKVTQQQEVVNTAFGKYTTAAEAFAASPSTETQSAYDTAKMELEGEQAKLRHYQQIQKLHDQELSLIEKGLQSAQDTVSKSKQIADTLELKTYVEGAKTAGQAVDETMDEYRYETGLMRDTLTLKDIGYVDPSLRVLPDVAEWRDEQRASLFAAREGITEGYKESAPKLASEKAELEGMRAEQAELDEKIRKGVADGTLTGQELESSLQRSKELESDISAKEKIVDSLQRVVDAYIQDNEEIKRKLDEIDRRVDAHRQEIQKQVGEQKQNRVKGIIRSDVETMKDLLDTPYSEYTDEQQSEFQRIMTIPDAMLPEHLKGFKEKFVAGQAKEAYSEDALREQYGTMSAEELLQHYDYETGQFKGGTAQARRLAEQRFQDVATDEQAVQRYKDTMEAKESAPKGAVQQYIEDQREAERRKRQAERDMKRAADRAERKDFSDLQRTASRFIDPVASIPGGYVQAFLSQADIEEKGAESLKELHEKTQQSIKRVRDDDMLTINQQARQIQQIEKRAAEQRIQIEKNVAEAKKKAYDDVFQHFSDTMQKMVIQQATQDIGMALKDLFYESQGWQEDIFGQYQHQRYGSFPVWDGGQMPSAPGQQPYGMQQPSQWRYDWGDPSGGGDSPIPPSGEPRQQGGVRYQQPPPQERDDNNVSEKEYGLLRGITTLGIGYLMEEHVWSKTADEETGKRPWWAQLGQGVVEAGLGAAATKYAVAPAYGAAKSGLGSVWEGLGFGADETAVVADAVSGAPDAVVNLPSLESVSTVADVSSATPTGIEQGVFPFGEVGSSAAGTVADVSSVADVGAVADVGLPAELTEVANVDFEPITRGFSEATKAGIEHGASEVELSPLVDNIDAASAEGSKGLLSGVTDFLGEIQGGLEALKVADFVAERWRDVDSIEERRGDETNTFRIAAGEGLGQLWEGVKATPGFVGELGGGAWDFAKDIGGFVADIPGTLNRTSGTGNWFTQTAKDIGGFFSDTFGGDSWRSVTDIAKGIGNIFSFDNEENDAIARRAGARLRQAEALRAAASLGRSSAMDLLAEHAEGFEEESMRMRQMQGEQSSAEGQLQPIIIQMYEDKNGRQRLKEERRQTVQLVKQHVVD